MSANTATYGGLNSNSGMSPGLWGDCPIFSIREGKDPNQNGRFTHMDFTKFKLSTNVNASVAYWDQGCLVFGDNGFAISALDVQGGGITIGSDGDNEGGSIQQVCFPYQIARGKRRLWFEARIKVSTIADTKFGLFVGLAESMTNSATVPIAAAGTIADQNLVGFHRLEGDGDKLDTIYKANGVTQVTVKADAVTLVANTFIKVGFKYDDNDKAGPFVLSFYADGVRLADTYTMASADGTDFPNDVRMSPIIAMLNATASTPGTASVSDIWCYQLMS